MSRPSRPRRRWWRRALASSASALVVALGASTPGVVREQVDAELRRAGLGDARYDVEELSADRIVLRDVALPPDLVAERVRIDFDPEAVVREGRGARITIEGATWTTTLDDDDLRGSALTRLIASSPGAAPGASPVERVRVVRSRAVIRGHTIAIEGEVDPIAPRASLVVRSELGTHEVTLRAGEDHGLAIEARPRDGVGALAIEADAALETLRFRLDGRAPRGWIAPAPLRLDGDPGVSASGVARRTEAGWVIDDLAATLDAAGGSIDGLALERVRAMAHGRVEIGPRVAIELDRAEIQAGRVVTEDVGARELELRGPVAIAIDEGGARVVARAPLALRVGQLSVGSGTSQIRAQRVALTLEARGDDPLATIEGSAVHLASAARGGAARLRGVLHAGSVRADGHVSFDLSPGEVRVRGAVRADTDALAHADSEIGLVGAHLDLEIGTDARGRVHAIGRGHAAHATWRSVPVGPTEGRIRISRPELAIDAIGRATRDAPFAIGARIGLARRGGGVHIGVPMSEVRRGDPLHRVLAELVGLRVLGRAGGQVDADLRTIGAGSARLALEGASLEPTSGRGGAAGVHGEFTLSALRPATSLAFEPVRFRELNVCDVVTTGPGTARLRFAADGKMEVEQMVAELGGGRVRLAPFRIDFDDPETTLDVGLENVELREIAAALSRGRLDATGRLDGRIGLYFHLGEEMRVVLGEGHLSARPPGRIRVIGARPAPADPSRDPDRLAGTLGRRVVAALSDFEYSRLSIDLLRDHGMTRARARVAGRGASTPQEVELALNVNGLQPLLDEVLRLWPTTTNPRTGSTP